MSPARRYEAGFDDWPMLVPPVDLASGRSSALVPDYYFLLPSLMPPRPYVLAETSWKAVKDTPFEVAILPWGATEPHNYHLPYGTDNYETGAIAERAAEIAWKKGAKVVVLPTVPFGGNDFRQMIRELQPKVDLFICTINWWTCVKGADYFDEPGDHAGEMETSVMMSLKPDLVLPLTEAGPGRARKFRIAGLRDGWVWSPRQWSSVTSDTGTGNPAASTPAKGEKFLSAVTERIGGFLFELAKADRNNMYE